jgi:zinc transport system substrate-binding protein
VAKLSGIFMVRLKFLVNPTPSINKNSIQIILNRPMFAKLILMTKSWQLFYRLHYSLLIGFLITPCLQAQETVVIAVSVQPLGTFVEKIGGPQVQTWVMVPPGRSPATYEPTPRQITALSHADFYLRVGVPFEDAWMSRFASTQKQLTIIDVRDRLELLPPALDTDSITLPWLQPPHHHSEHSGRHIDHHVWTDPRLVRQISRHIAEQLVLIDPEHKADYLKRLHQFDQELVTLHHDLLAQLTELPRRTFLVYHPAWDHFARAYGLQQIPIEYQGKEPGPRYLAEIINFAKSNHLQVIFTQPQFHSRAAQHVAQAIQGRIEVLDPLAADYSDNLRYVAERIATAAHRRLNVPTGD